MGKKKTKKNISFSDRLALSLQQGEPGDLIAEAGKRWFTTEEFTSVFDKSRSVLTAGPDPREIVLLPSVFQQAFLKLAEKNEDEDLILDIFSMSSDKETKKEAKGVMHRLRSRGIQVSLPEESVVSLPEKRAAEENPELPCYFTPATGSGSRMIWLATYVRGGVGIYQAEVNDVDGLLEFSGGVIGRSRYRGLSKDLLSKEEVPLSEITYSEARHRINQAVSLSREMSRAIPEGYLEASSTLPDPSESVQLPDPRQIYNADSVLDQRQDLQKATELHDLPEFTDWIPSEDAIKKLHAKFQEIDSSQLTINAQQKADQIDRALDQVVIDMLQDETIRSRYQNRLFEMVLHFSRVGKQDQARLCACAAWQLSEPSFQPLDSPFFSQLVRKMFKKPEEIAEQMQGSDPSAQSNDPTPPASGNLIVSP